MEEEQPNLPPGINKDDLRFVHPQHFPVYMSMRGWSAEAYLDVDDNPAKSRIVLSRPVGPEFGIPEFEVLAVSMNIIDEESGEFKEGYKLQVDTFNEINPVSRSLRKAINPHEDQPRCLIFTFEGFSTQETMNALEVITSAFERPEVVVRHSWLRRTLGRASLRNKPKPQG